MRRICFPPRLLDLSFHIRGCTEQVLKLFVFLGESFHERRPLLVLTRKLDVFFQLRWDVTAF